MPGPGAKRKSKSKAKANLKSPARSSSMRDGYINEIENAQGWNTIVAVLCVQFDLPDLTTRSGLKKVHANFSDISKRLSTTYDASRAQGNEKMMGGIVGIWAKMCSDAILRDKLFKAGLLSKLMPLLDIPITRHVGLQALSTVTHHCGEHVRGEIALQTPTLLRLIQEFNDDPKVIELAITTMAHAIGAVFNKTGSPDMKVIKVLDVPAVLRITIESMRKPAATPYLIDHAMSLLSSATLHCDQECRAFPPMLDLLVACLRCTDITMRCTALGGLIRLNHADAELEIHGHDPRLLMAAIEQGFPAALEDKMLDFGPSRCDTTILLYATAEYQKAMIKCAQDHDLYALGKTLAGLITRTEFAIADGWFQDENGRAMDIGLPFVRWTDSLPHAASALRARGTPADLDMADIVDCKFFIIRQRIPEAIALAQRAIQRSPDVAYYYYAISLGADRSVGLRAVKKGLKCKTITPFVRLYMLWRAIEHAGDMGVTMLQQTTKDDAHYAEGVAFLMSACEDAKTFVAEAPPDTRHLRIILNWYILLTLAIRGPELSADLRELDNAFHKIDVTDQFCNFLRYPHKKTQMYLTRKMIVERYPTATKEWTTFVTRLNDIYAADGGPDLEVSPSQAEDHLAAWLDEFHVEDGDVHPRRCSNPKVSSNSVALYRCSWCGNPSAVLKKCSRCGKTRYCDAGCQRSHWSAHKVVCKT